MFKKQETMQKNAPAEIQKPAKSKEPQQKLNLNKSMKRKAPEGEKKISKVFKKPKAQPVSDSAPSVKPEVTKATELDHKEEVSKVSKKFLSTNLYTREEDVDEDMPPSNLGSKRVTSKQIEDSSDDEVLAPDS
jgi:hypothetical protein